MELESIGGDTAQPWEGFLPEAIPHLSQQEAEGYSGRCVLITGAGGYLGSGLARALGRMDVARLVLLDQSEYGLYRLEQDLRGHMRPLFVVGNILDRPLLQEIFGRDAPTIVFHAAALKHVPLLEGNPLAAAETNIFGTQALLDAAEQAGVERFVLLSTDKAADAISTMGATKRIAEQIVMEARGRGGDVFTAVRLCNVLGSTGSVAPLFTRQMADGGPLTLTHREATRYFVSQRDAVRLLLRSGVMSPGIGMIAPALERAYPVWELAEFMLGRHLGRGVKPRIVEIGLREGEKLHEQIVASGEKTRRLSAGDFFEIVTSYDRQALEQTLEEALLARKRRDVALLFRALQRAVPSFQGPMPGAARLHL